MNAPINQLASYLEAKASLNDDEVFDLIDTFNHAILGNVDGPNCTDRATCNNNCCSIMIDIPHVLARKYMEQGRIDPGDVRRGDVFAWTLNVRPDSNKCVFFSPSLHGCRAYIDDLGSRPPQCAVYPAGYTAGADRCKAGAGPWIVKDATTGVACERLMAVYKRFCLEERERIKREVMNSTRSLLEGRFSQLLSSNKPSNVAGIKDTWLGFEPLLAEGRSFSAKQFCDPGCATPFLECNFVCDYAKEGFTVFLSQILPAFIAARDMQEEYSTLELKDFARRVKE